MPPAIPVDQELLLKKRARRRLVGAIALIILLMIILPIVLKDRVKSISNEHANITMDEGADVNTLPPAFETEPESSQTIQTTDETNSSAPKIEDQAEAAVNSPTLSAENNQANNIDESNQAKTVAKTSSEDLIANKVAELERKQTADSKPSAVSAQDNKEQSTTSAYTIQVGAFSDLNNMKQTQISLTKAGFTTTTEKVTTPKGDSIRLMAGSYTTRESANEGLLKLKSIGLDGMIKPKSSYDKSIVRN